MPDDVAASVQQRVLDVLGLCVAAHRLPTSAAAIGHVLDQGGHPQATAVGVPTAVTAAQAAFANGVLAHSLDYDDTHLPSVLHPSASVVPAALAAAEHAGAAGEQTVRAIAVGLEVAVRLGMAGYDERARQLGVLRARPARHLDHRRDGLARSPRRCCTAPTRRASSTRSA